MTYDTQFNQLLSALLKSSKQRLSPHLKKVFLSAGKTVHEPDEIVTTIYFPQNAICSSIITMSGGSMIQVSLVGNEGLIGLPAILDGNVLTTESVVLVSGTAWAIPLEIIKKEFQRAEELHQLLLRYTTVYISRICQIAACNSLHHIEHRLARFLLLTQDALQQQTLPLTQKSISAMLGVRRASITETALSLQKQQIIQYSRGKIIIIDRTKLEAIACECYNKIQYEYKCLFNE